MASVLMHQLELAHIKAYTTRGSNKSFTHQRVHFQESQKNRVEDDGEDTCAVEGDDDVGGEVEEMIFKGLTFAIFEVDDAEGLAKIIRDYGGKVISENACEIADVGVVPMLGCQGACAAREIVTEAWVNICVSDSQLHPYNMLEVFHPLTILPHVTPLNNCVITISGILDIERGIITDVITLLGGIVQDCFVRVAKEPYLACTHLIVNSNEGSKYQAAVKWNVPALHKSWVFECGRTGIKAPEEQFRICKFIVDVTQQETTETKMKPKGGGGSAADPSPVMQCFSGPTGESARKIVETVSHIHQPGHNASTHNHKNRSTPNSNTKSIAILNRIEINLSKNHIGIGCDAKENDSFPDSPLQNCRIKALKEVTMKHASPTSVNKAANDVDTPSKFINNNFQPNFNIQDQSPVPDVRKQLRTSLPLEEVFAENIGLAMNNIASGQSHDESFTQRRQGDDGLEVVQEESKKPLVGVIISVAKKLSKNQAEYNKLAVMLGAQYRWMYTYECTHFVFQGKLNDTNREFRTAREQCKQIVSPFWLVACNEHQSRLDESLYPHTLQHPVPHNMLVGSSKTPNRMPASRVLYPYQSPLNNSFATSNRPSPSNNGMNTPTQPAQHSTTPAAQNPSSHTMREDTQTTELLDGLKKINEASKSVKMNKVKSFDNQDGSVDNVKSALSRNSSSDDIDVKGSGVKSSKQSGSKPPDKLKDAHTQASQVEVVWDDPFVSRPGSDILPKNGIEPIKLPNEEMNQSAVTETEKDNLRTVEPGKRADLKKIQREYVFNFSGFKDQDKSSLVQIVESLGGSCVDANSSSPCSHLITSTAKRSEKFLVCVSVGKWILHDSYLHACKQSQCFVEEAPYEWGSDEILKLYPDLKPQEFKLARAARRWRLALQGSPSQKEGAFDRWNCLLFINANRVDGFARLLQAGGAQVCANKLPSSLIGITHAFIETKNCPVKVDFKTLVDEGIPCLKFDYIVNFLTDHPPPPFHLFYVQEVELPTRADDNKRKRSRLESPQDVPLKKKQ
ncbi:hypothetical protein HELRODRAFT_190326 [Helobdella robusta]|uniref:BRCT domain-containing protein n=1 Tax=Helobdella robusta TaxID=6412 RepID=T1FRW9_HELRO|nr:hypothetical protein HELRODRAFT_190326 [Helobdella robusta]ESO09917.1 hypothetical protein HELRODRAFT_190326 [Helobdella robusta]